MAVEIKEITIAHSPDSDDAFMFYGLAAEKVDTGGIKVNQVLKDIQSLNQDAMNGRYEVSAISFAAYPQLAKTYALMPCGASIGYKYGPVVVSKIALTKEELAKTTIAIPGKLTTAYLALQLYQPGLNVIEMPFDQIQEAVKQGKVEAGLIIHEGQLTYEKEGLKKVVDLGEWWFAETQLPLPLGGNVVRKDLGMALMKKTTKILQESIKYSLSHRQEALDYAMRYARDLARPQADTFVGMYVNDFTVDYGDSGRAALVKLFEMAYQKGVIKQSIELEFVEI